MQERFMAERGIIYLRNANSTSSENRQAGASICYSASEKPILDDFHDSTREVGELLKRCDERLTFDNLNIAERYVRNDFNICVNLRPVGYGQDEYFFISRLPIGGGGYRAPANAGSNRELPTCGERASCQRYECLVFVHNVNGVESVEQIVPSFIWFEGMDHGGGIRAQSLYFFLNAGRFKVFLASPGREIGIRNLGRAILHGKGAGSVIERRAQSVDDFTGNNGDLAGRGELHASFQQVILSTRINLFEKLIDIQFPEIFYEHYQFLDVGIGPFNL